MDLISRLSGLAVRPRGSVSITGDSRVPTQRLDAFEMKGLRKRFCGFRGQQRKLMSGFLTKLE